jgi:hypothetical protein
MTNDQNSETRVAHNRKSLISEAAFEGRQPIPEATITQLRQAYEDSILNSDLLTELNKKSIGYYPGPKP